MSGHLERYDARMKSIFSRHAAWIGALVILLLIILFYLPTWQVIPNGSDHYYMIDVGETQVVLNVWGTLHATGYPLYVLTGSALAALMKGIGIDAAAAPALVSLLWGAVALGMLYALAAHLTGNMFAAAAAVFLLGLTRTIWIHNVIAEIYSFGLALLALLLLLGLWRKPIPGRIYWLALIGGVGVAHHRALAMLAPALLIAVWDELIVPSRRLPLKIGVSLLLGALGFLQYLYLPLRAWAGAAWVYGEPETWQGLLDQFWGVEAARFIGLPDSLDALNANFVRINAVLITDVSIAGITLGGAGLILALRQPETRRAALALIVSGAAAYSFHVLYYTDVLSALIIAVLVSFAFGWAFLLHSLVERVLHPPVHRNVQANLRPGFIGAGLLLLERRVIAVAGAAVYLGLCIWLIGENFPFIRALTTDPTGLNTIAEAEQTPPGAALMIEWGPRHFAAGFARDVRGTLPGVTLVDHKADFAALAARGGRLVTPSYTFYNRPVAWWEAQLGGTVYLRAAAPHLVEIATAPLLTDSSLAALAALDSALTCSDGQMALRVDWVAPAPPEADLSVFVHLLDASGALIAQADQSAPVYGWRPLTTWTANEIVRDIYPLPRRDDAAAVRYGLYRQLPDGAFENVLAYTLPVSCEAD